MVIRIPGCTVGVSNLCVKDCNLCVIPKESFSGI